MTRFNNIRRGIPDLAGLFRQQAVPGLHNIAEISELNEKSDQLARVLTDLGVGEGSLVPICLDHSAEFIIAVLGVVKAGAKYLSVDTDDSSERIAGVLEDTGTHVVISMTTCNHLLVYGANLIINLDEPYSW